MNINWIKEFPAAITVCDTEGNIIEMNNKSAEVFINDGGYELLGKNLFDCHSDNSTSIIKELIAEKKTNVYTIEKNGRKKLIYQAPWYNKGNLKGLVELSIEIPYDIPHHKR